MSSTAAWEPGKSVGHYALLASIAKGGMGEIWLAHQSGPEGFFRPVVVKRILEDDTGTGSLEGMLLDEARIAAQLNHPNIVQVYELGECDGSYFIAMEYLHGENLASLVRRGLKTEQPLPIACAVRILSETAEALAYAHAKKGLDGASLGLVHRDVSPQNILVTYNGNTKLVDFGIAKATGKAVKTADGSIKGKFAYMSPEQARGEPLDGRSDVFSLGVVMFEVLSQSRFFQGHDDLAVFQSLAQGGDLPRLRDRTPGLPAALLKICERALHPRRDERYASARALADDLETWLKTTHEGSVAQLEQWLQRAFVDRIAQREQLIASAGQGGKVTVSDAVLKSNRSIPGNTPPTRAEPRAAPRRGAPWVVLGGGLLMVGTGVAVALLLRPPPAPASPEPQPPPPPPPPVVAPIAKGGVTETSASVAVGPAEARPVPDAGAPGVAHATAAAKKAPAAFGTLSIDTTPWTEVSLGKSVLGDTPLVNTPVPAGLHKLRLRNPGSSIDRTVEVEILPGKNKAMRLKL